MFMMSLQLTENTGSGETAAQVLWYAVAISVRGPFSTSGFSSSCLDPRVRLPTVAGIIMGRPYRFARVGGHRVAVVQFVALIT
jgi:hypothetical protein